MPGNCCGNQPIAIDLNWIQPRGGEIICADTAPGNNRVTAAVEGFVSAVNADIPGGLIMAGFDDTGRGSLYYHPWPGTRFPPAAEYQYIRLLKLQQDHGFSSRS